MAQEQTHFDVINTLADAAASDEQQRPAFDAAAPPTEDLNAREPDTVPDRPSQELVEAIEWLKKSGVIEDREPPAFSRFFHEK